MGDINDGFGKDYFEQRFNRSAVEILLGNVWHPELILKSVLNDKPKLGNMVGRHQPVVLLTQ